jgi:hypothetical protein
MSNQAASLKAILDSTIISRQNSTIRQAWTSEFNLAIDDLPSLFFILSQVVQSLREIRAKVQTMNTMNPEIICAPLETLESAICFPNLDASIGSILGVYGPRAQMALEMASSYFDKANIDPHATQDDLKKIEQDLGDLTSFVTEGDIDPELRQIMLDLLECIRRALAEYRIRGNSSLRQVLDQSLGRLMREYKESYKSSKDAATVIQRFGQLLTLIDKAVSIAKNAKPILEYMTTFIPYLTSSK